MLSKEEFIKLLRDTDPALQTTGKLRVHEGETCQYCALGLLCNAIDPSGWDSTDRWHGHLYNPRARYLPDWLEEYVPYIGDYEGEGALKYSISTMNDRGLTYSQIADYLEGTLSTEQVRDMVQKRPRP